MIVLGTITISTHSVLPAVGKSYFRVRCTQAESSWTVWRKGSPKWLLIDSNGRVGSEQSAAIELVLVRVRRLGRIATDVVWGSSWNTSTWHNLTLGSIWVDAALHDQHQVGAADQESFELNPWIWAGFGRRLTLMNCRRGMIPPHSLGDRLLQWGWLKAETTVETARS